MGYISLIKVKNWLVRLSHWFFCYVMDPGYKTYLLLEVVKMFESHCTQEESLLSVLC